MASLQSLGCELGQGFLFARALDRTALVEYLVDEDSAESDAA